MRTNNQVGLLDGPVHARMEPDPFIQMRTVNVDAVVPHGAHPLSDNGKNRGLPPSVVWANRGRPVETGNVLKWHRWLIYLTR